MKLLSVIIPVFNGINYTKTSLENLTDLQKGVNPSKLKMAIIVVDDGSTDGTNEYVKTNYPDCVVLSGDGNLWWSGGINMGARYAVETLKTDFILLWNNDIICSDDYFTLLSDILNNLDSNTFIGSKIYSKEDIIWSMGGFFNPVTGRKNHFAYQQKDSDNYNKIESVDWLPGMGTILPAEAISRIGYWDQVNFPQYHGDSDYTYRAKLAGYRILVFPQLKLWNDISNTGLEHHGNFRTLLKSLKHIKSYSNIRCDLLFYRKYARTPLAYSQLLVKYGKLFMGFFKWKILGYFNIRKSS
jgi:GT2 family glycosyltransferase